MNPITKIQHSWTPLHEFALAGHNDDVSLAENLVTRWGIPVDGRPSDNVDIETPFSLAIQHNAFKLDDILWELGAEINALSVRSMFLVAEYPMTVLGHIITSNSSHSDLQLRYILSKKDALGKNCVDFVVEPQRGLTALHRAAWARKGLQFAVGDAPNPDRKQRITVTNASHSLVHLKATPNNVVSKRKDVDVVPHPERGFTDLQPATLGQEGPQFSSSVAPSQEGIPDINHKVVLELLQHFRSPNELGQKSRFRGWTALHFAVDGVNAPAVQALIQSGADVSITDDNHQTPLILARTMSIEKQKISQSTIALQRVIDLFI